MVKISERSAFEMKKEWFLCESECESNVKS